MKIGIIGAGMIGGTLGPLWLKAGHAIRYGTRHPEQVQVPGASSDTVAAVGQWAEVLVIAIPLGATPAVAQELGSSVQGKVVLDTGNLIAGKEPTDAAAIAQSGGSGVWVASHLPGAHVVKAFNTVYFKILQSQSGRTDGPQLGIPLAGDDAAALDTAQGLVRDAGFEPVVFGALSQARHFENGTPVWNTGASAEALRRYLSEVRAAS